MDSVTNAFQQEDQSFNSAGTFAGRAFLMVFNACDCIVFANPAGLMQSGSIKLTCLNIIYVRPVNG